MYIDTEEAVDPGADLRGGVLPYFVRLQARSFRERSIGASESALATARNEALEDSCEAALPVGD